MSAVELVAMSDKREQSGPQREAEPEAKSQPQPGGAPEGAPNGRPESNAAPTQSETAKAANKTPLTESKKAASFFRRNSRHHRKHDDQDVLVDELERSETTRLSPDDSDFENSTAHIHRHSDGESVQAQLNAGAAEALYVLQRLGDKHHRVSITTKNPKQQEVDNANIVFRDKVFGRCRWQARDICDNPSGRVILLGVFNKLVNYTLIVAILGSVIFFILDSFNLTSRYGPYCDPDLNPNRTEQISNGTITCTSQLFAMCGEDCFSVFEWMFTAIFLLEFFVRLICTESCASPQKWTALVDENGRKIMEVKPDTPFLHDPMNYCDFVSVLPPFLELLFDDGASSSVSVLKLLRVLRVFKIARHFNGSKVMSLTVQMSWRGLIVALFFLAVFLFLASILLQVVDPCIAANDCTFVDPVNGAYFVVVTMSTVGYGDQVPQITFSRLLTALFMFFGTFYIAMPLAVVGNKFEAAYKMVYGTAEATNTISAFERRQIILNQSYQLSACIAAGRDALNELKQAHAQNEGFATQVRLRKKLSRSMKQLASTHADICTHVDILTPSTFLLKKRHGAQQLGRRMAPAAPAKLKLTSNGSLRIAASVASVAQAAFKRVHANESNGSAKSLSKPSMPTLSEADEAEDIDMETGGNAASTSSTAGAHDAPRAAWDNAANLNAEANNIDAHNSRAPNGEDEHEEGVVQVEVVSRGDEDERVVVVADEKDALSPLALGDSPLRQRGSTHVRKQDPALQEAAAAILATRSDGNGGGDSGSGGAGNENEESDEHVDFDPNAPQAFAATVTNVSCSKRYFNVKFDEVDREVEGMDRMEIDVGRDRIRPMEAQPAPSSISKIRSRPSFARDVSERISRLQPGDRVWVFTEEIKDEGIALEMEAERRERQHIIKLAKAGRENGNFRDALWLFLEAPEEMKKLKSECAGFSRAFSFLRIFIVTVSVIGVVIQTDSGFNTYGPETIACNREAAAWCENVEWAAQLEPSRYGDIADLNWPCYPQQCSNYSATEDLREPGKRLLCEEGADDIFYPGILADPSSFPFRHPGLRLNVTCDGTTTTSEPTVVWDEEEGVEYRVDTVVTVGASPFQSSKPTTSLMNDVGFGDVLVCDRRPCVDNSAERLIGTSSSGSDDVSDSSTRRLSEDNDHSVNEVGEQLVTNQFFGYLEVFFCLWYFIDFFLNIIAIRGPSVTDEVGARRWYTDVAIWIELLSMIVCLAELVAVSLEAGSLAYTVWGLPFVATFSNTIMRPLRVIVMIRLCVMMRGVAAMKILVRTMKETYERLAVPIFFLLVFSLIFGGLFFTTETILSCVAVAECSDGSQDITQCPGSDSELETGVGTVIYYRRTDDVLLGPSEQDLCLLQSMWDAIWLAFVTISTVGYGVVYPVSSAGKGVAMIAAAFGTVYLAMPLSIVGSRFYAIYEEYEKVTSLRQGKTKFHRALGAVLLMNLASLGQLTREAEHSGDATALKAELQRWEQAGKSKTQATYIEAKRVLAQIEAEVAEFHSQHTVSSANKLPFAWVVTSLKCCVCMVGCGG